MKGTVVENRLVAENTHALTLALSERIEGFAPGQFAHIRVPASGELLLRRPISISRCDGDSLRLILRVAGEGTRRLAALREGDEADLLAPLGKGFPAPAGNTWLVGGGIGCAPLLSFAKQTGVRFSAFLGYKSSAEIFCAQEFDALCGGRLYIATEEGSLGEKGYITALLAEALRKRRPDAIYCCGPAPLYRALAELVETIPTYISLEQRMGCGMGGCEVCVCKTYGGYHKVCKSGPVYPIGEVELDG